MPLVSLCKDDSLGMLTNVTTVAMGFLLVAVVLLGWLGGVRQNRPAGALPQLTDVTQSTGIKFFHASSPDKKYIVESMSGGVALIDYDRDGRPRFVRSQPRAI